MRIVLIDPDRRSAPSLDRVLAEAGHDVALVESTAVALDAVRHQAIDLVLVASAPGGAGLEGVLPVLRQAGYAGPVLVVASASLRAVR